MVPRFYYIRDQTRESPTDPAPLTPSPPLAGTDSLVFIESAYLMFSPHCGAQRLFRGWWVALHNVGKYKFVLSFIISIIISHYNNSRGWSTTDDFATRCLHFPCSSMSPESCWTPDLSIPWCCLPTSYNLKINVVSVISTRLYHRFQLFRICAEFLGRNFHWEQPSYFSTTKNYP